MDGEDPNPEPSSAADAGAVAPAWAPYPADCPGDTERAPLEWHQAGGGPTADGWNLSARQPAYGDLWKLHTRLGTDERDRIDAPPVVAGGTLIAGGSSLWAVDIATGQLRWSAPTGNYTMDNLALAADRVIVSLGDFGVAAYSVANGTEMWRRSDFISLGGPRLDCGVVWVGATDRPNWNGPEREVLLGMTGRLLALDPATGATVRAGPTTRPPGAPIMVGELLVSGDDSGTVRAYRRLDGSLAWAWSPGTPPVFWNQPRLASDGTHVVVARRSTEVGDSYEELVVLRASDGVAERTLGKWFPFGAPVIAYGMVFAETGPVRRTIAWDIATGEPRWVADGAGWPAVAFDGMLLFGSYEGEVRLLDARTGLFVELLSGGGFMSAIVSCGRIYGGFREADGTPGVWALGDPGASGCPRSEVF